MRDDRIQFNVFHELEKSGSLINSLFKTKNSKELLNIGRQAPSPSKDYYQLLMTCEQVRTSEHLKNMFQKMSLFLLFLFVSLFFKDNREKVANMLEIGCEFTLSNRDERQLRGFSSR